MPRPVVPIRALPRCRSDTLSSAMWWGMIRCALAEISRRSQDTPRSASPSISSSSTAGSMTTPLPITGTALAGQHARGQQVEGVALLADDHGVPGVVAALVAHHVVHAVAEQVRGLALALVAPLRADEHDGGHVSLPPHQNESPCASATGALASSVPDGLAMAQTQGRSRAGRGVALLSARNTWQRWASSSSPIASAARPARAAQRRKPWLGSCSHGHGPVALPARPAQLVQAAVVAGAGERVGRHRVALGQARSASAAQAAQ